MQGKEIVNLLAQAEDAVLKSIALSGDGLSSPDYANLTVRLELARRISAIKDDAKKVFVTESANKSKKKSEKIPVKPVKVRLPENAFFSSVLVNSSKWTEKEIARLTSEEFKLPAYFIEDECLYMFGASTKDRFKMYRRVVPMRDVSMVIDCILSLLPEDPFFSISDVEKRAKGLPGYKVRTTVAALQECGIIRKASSGKYGPTEDSRPVRGSWLDALYELPKRHDLLKKYERAQS